jgi:hypothetical protein
MRRSLKAFATIGACIALLMPVTSMAAKTITVPSGKIHDHFTGNGKSVERRHRRGRARRL